MKERGVLFSASMVRAILAGRKTQTRRIVKPMRLAPLPREEGYEHGGLDAYGFSGLIRAYPSGAASVHPLPRSPYGVPGDRLWVRETWAAHWMYNDVPPRECGSGLDGDNYWFRADGAAGKSQLGHAPDGLRGKWRPSIFLPRWASRITLEVTGIRVERLQSISEDDARAEGLKEVTKDGGRTVKCGIPDRDGWPGTDDDGWPWQEWCRDPRQAFAKLWDKINGARASWSSNPWLWVVEFRVLQPNLDPRPIAPGGSAAEAADRDPPTPGQQPESRLPDDDDS